MYERDKKLKKKVSEAVDTSAIYQILDHLKSRGKLKLSIKKLNKFMQNQGRNEFTYDIFKTAYDSDIKLQSMVSNFDQNTIELKSDEMDGLPSGNDNDAGGDSISTMAKRAVDLTDL